MAASVYYYPAGSGKAEENRLFPAPMIKLTPEYYYANDTVIGYTYNITLDGYATSLDTRVISTTPPEFSGTLESIKRTKNILNKNNGILEVVDHDVTVFIGSGSLIRSLNFNESSNLWINYCPYTVELECNEIQLANCSGSGYAIECYNPNGSGTYIPSGIIQSPLLLDMRQYKVKNFNDSWTFSTDEGLYKNDTDRFRNESINANYSISAQGKHYFRGSGLVPAWQQAKDFCQYKLYSQATGLIGNILYRQGDGQDSCEDNNIELSGLHLFGQPGLLDGLPSGDYGVYNEKITTSISESDGKFDATYSCIIKRTSSVGPWAPFFKDVTHNHTTSTDITDDGKQKNVQITVNGTIQGLIPGGLIRTSGILSFPNRGHLLINSVPDSQSGNKYINANRAYSNIISSNSGNLSNAFLTSLGITYTSLEASGACDPSTPPPAISFNTTHNFLEGSINYTATYDTKTACRGNGKTYQNINISVDDKVPVIAEFVVPGRSGGPIIQRLNVEQPRKITITIDGAIAPSGIADNNLPNCCSNLDDMGNAGCDQTIKNVLDAQISALIPSNLTNLGKLTQNQFVYSVDGSFSITKSYIITSGT